MRLFPCCFFSKKVFRQLAGQTPRRGDETLDAGIHVLEIVPFIANHNLRAGARIYLTRPTADLIQPMLMESVKAVNRRISENDKYYYHRYADKTILHELLKLLIPCRIDIHFDLAGLDAVFFHSGHILGAAGIIISDGKYTLAYNGDLCQEDQDIITGCRFPGNINVDCQFFLSVSAGRFTHDIYCRSRQLHHCNLRHRFDYSA